MSYHVSAAPKGETRPPFVPIMVAALGLCCSVSILILQPHVVDNPAPHYIGWICGAFTPIVMLVAYRLRDRAKRLRTNYVIIIYRNDLMVALTVFGVCVGGYHGWLIADWVAS